MKKLLIVEDEKMIRQGIQAMVKRSPIHVEEIILCKNGEEAYEIIKNNKIDILITDIRMPKKDGITLVKEIQALPNIPKVIVISGFDDFSYAVELMRYGAKEYILKPIDREKINSILVKLEKEIEEEQEQHKDNEKIGYQQFKYILLNSSISETEVSDIENKFREYFLRGEYVLCCTNYTVMKEVELPEVIYLDDIYGQSVFIVDISKKEELLSDLLKDYFVGVSKVHKTLLELREAYGEAFYARKSAFASGSFITEFCQPKGKKETVSEEMIDQFVQIVGTSKFEVANKFLTRIIYKTRQGQIEPDHFELIMKSIVEKICVIYKNLIDSEDEISNDLKSIYKYDNAGSYYEAISNWIETINEKIVTDFDNYKNKQKIQRAIVYIHENYNKDLNMAVVSNYISMNYSLFSYAFKQYTKMNFVSYLKSIRINEAKRLLEETDKKIIEVSNLVGYENEKNFMKIFKHVCGVSPSEYRKNVQVGKLNIMK